MDFKGFLGGFLRIWGIFSGFLGSFGRGSLWDFRGSIGFLEDYWYPFRIPGGFHGIFEDSWDFQWLFREPFCGFQSIMSGFSGFFGDPQESMEPFYGFPSIPLGFSGSF